MASQRVIKTRKGLDLPLSGAPQAVIETAQSVNTVALLGADYIGLEPKMLVKEGDAVSVGQPLFQQKRDPAIGFVAPASGRVEKINRGERRVLRSVVIRIQEDGETASEQNAPIIDANDLNAQTLRSRLLDFGLWAAFRTRPYSRIPASDAFARSIFVTACDTRPLSGIPDLIVSEYAEDFAYGLNLLAHLAEKKVYLCTASDWSGPTGSVPKIDHVNFEGPHPAGLPGTHIHHLDPVGPETDVWHIGYQDVIAIGKLIGRGVYWTERVIALGGPGFVNPRMVRTKLGADLVELTAGELIEPPENNLHPRVISGCVLSGRHAIGAEAFLGRYHNQVSAVPQERPYRRRRWRRSHDRKYSFSNLLSSLLSNHPDLTLTTDQNGRATAMVPVDDFERLIPMDILAAPLLKSLLVTETDRAQALGCLELDEEDLALCSFVCPGKNDYASLLRRNLDIIEKDG